MALVTRSGKGSPLTIEEMDNNFTYLEGLSGGSSSNNEGYSQLIIEVSDIYTEYVTEFIIGEVYQIPSVELGDDFTNIGYVDRNPFIATGTTPNAFTNGTEVSKVNTNVNYTIYKNTFENLSIYKTFDQDNYLCIGITFSNFSDKFNSDSSSNIISYDTTTGYVISPSQYNRIADLKVFNKEGTNNILSIL